MQNKECSNCGVVKPLSDFQYRKASKDGLTSSCKICLKLRDKIRDQDPKRKKMKETYAKGIGKEKTAAAKKRYIDKNPKKRSIHIITGNAIRDGILEKKAL